MKIVTLVGARPQFIKAAVVGCFNDFDRLGFSLYKSFFRFLYRWIQSLELEACRVGTELPVDLRLVMVTLGLPSRDFSTQGLNLGNPAIQTLAGQDGEFTFSHIEPTAMFGGVVKLQLAGDPACFGGCKGLVEGGWGMGIEIIHHQLWAIGIPPFATIDHQGTPVKIIETDH